MYWTCHHNLIETWYFNLLNNLQLSKSFLEPLGLNNDSRAKNLILEEFIDGMKKSPNKTIQRSDDDIKVLEGINKKLEEYYGWNSEQSFVEMAGQNCSDMLIQVGKTYYIIRYFLIRKYWCNWRYFHFSSIQFQFEIMIPTIITSALQFI